MGHIEQRGRFFYIYGRLVLMIKESRDLGICVVGSQSKPIITHITDPTIAKRIALQECQELVSRMDD